MNRPHQERGSLFFKWIPPAQVERFELPILDFLLLRRQRFNLRGNAGALLLKLINPAAGLVHSKRAAGCDMAIALIKHEACGLAFEFSGK